MAQVQSPEGGANDIEVSPTQSWSGYPPPGREEEGDSLEPPPAEDTLGSRDSDARDAACAAFLDSIEQEEAQYWADTAAGEAEERGSNSWQAGGPLSGDLLAGPWAVGAAAMGLDSIPLGGGGRGGSGRGS